MSEHDAPRGMPRRFRLPARHREGLALLAFGGSLVALFSLWPELDLWITGLAYAGEATHPTVWWTKEGDLKTFTNLQTTAADGWAKAAVAHFSEGAVADETCGGGSSDGEEADDEKNDDGDDVDSGDGEQADDGDATDTGDGEEADDGDDESGSDCVDGIDSVTGEECDGGPSANQDDGEEADDEGEEEEHGACEHHDEGDGEDNDNVEE